MYDESPEALEINAAVDRYYQQSGQRCTVDIHTSRHCGQLLVDYCNRTKEKSAFILIVTKGYEQAHYLAGVEGGLHFWQQLSNKLSNILPERSRLCLLPFGFSIHVWDDEIEPCIQLLLKRVTHLLHQHISIPNKAAHSEINIHIDYLLGYLIYPDDCGFCESFPEVTRYVSSAAWAESNVSNQIHRYTKLALDQQVRRAKIHQRLAEAIDNQLISFVYQPQYDVIKKEIVGVESLMRWTDTELGIVSPQEFIGVAESCEHILPLTELSVDMVASFVAKYQLKFDSSVRFSINISKSVFNWKQFDLYSVFDACIKKYPGVENFLDIEITESSYFDPSLSTNVTKTLSKLADLGIRTIIDDFGSGYGSLSLISSGIVGAIKLDRELTSKLVTNSAETEFLEILCNATRHISLELIAEGVETNKQKAILMSKGVSMIQGYLYARPMVGDDLVNFVYQQSSQEWPKQQVSVGHP